MTNNELLALSQSLDSLGELSGSIKFNYCIARNSAILNSEVENLKESVKPSKEYTEKFDNLRIELAKKHAKKDNKGAPVLETVVEDGNPVQRFVLTDVKAFEKELEVLKKDNEKLLDARDKQLEDFKKLLEEESDIKLFQVSLDEVPPAISVAQMTSIILLIKEEGKK